MSYSIVQGVAENEDIECCPYCGADIESFHGNGKVSCGGCERKFYVIDATED